jgi:hypothetical protein
MSHRELYDAVWSGPGPAGSTAPESLWTFVDSSLNNIADSLTEGLEQARVSWTGTAAENAIESVNALALWARQASLEASRVRDAVVAQGEYIGYTRNTIPPPPPDDADHISPVAFAPIVGIPVLLDWQAKEAEQNELAQQAVHVMEIYESNTAQNKPHIQAFAAPTAVTADGGGLGAISGVFGRVVGNVGAITAAALNGAAGSGVIAGAGLPVGLGAAVGAAGAAGAAGVVGAVGAGGAAGVAGAAGAAGGAAGLPVAVGGGVVPAPSGQGRPGTGVAGGRVPPQLGPPGTGRVPQIPGSTGVPPEGVPAGSRVPAGGLGGAGSPQSRGLPGGYGGVEPTSPRGGSPGGLGGGTPTSPRGGFPGGIPAEGESVRPGVAPSTTTGAAAGRTAGSHGFFPPGAGGAGAQSREHRRPPYLVDDTDAFGDDRYFTPAVITPDDYIPRRA